MNDKLYENLKKQSDEVIMCDRTGNIISVYLKGDVKVLFSFGTINTAQKKYSMFQRDLLNRKVGVI